LYWPAVKSKAGRWKSSLEPAEEPRRAGMKVNYLITIFVHRGKLNRENPVKTNFATLPWSLCADFAHASGA
jgi:hypothetical protein